MRASRPVKPAGLVVYSGRPSAVVVAAIIRSAAGPRGLRPAAMAAGSCGRRCGLPRHQTAPGRTRSRPVAGSQAAARARRVCRRHRARRCDAPRGVRGQFGQGDGSDRHLVGQFGRVDPFPQDQDVRVQHALPELLIAHSRYQPRGPALRPGPTGTPPGRRPAHYATWRRTSAGGRTAGDGATGSAPRSGDRPGPRSGGRILLRKLRSCDLPGATSRCSRLAVTNSYV